MLDSRSVVVLAVDAASDAGRQDAAAAGQQPGPLGCVPGAADEGSAGGSQAADDEPGGEPVGAAPAALTAESLPEDPTTTDQTDL